MRVFDGRSSQQKKLAVFFCELAKQPITSVFPVSFGRCLGDVHRIGSLLSDQKILEEVRKEAKRLHLRDITQVRSVSFEISQAPPEFLQGWNGPAFFRQTSKFENVALKEAFVRSKSRKAVAKVLAKIVGTNSISVNRPVEVLIDYGREPSKLSRRSSISTSRSESPAPDRSTSLITGSLFFAKNGDNVKHD